MLVNYNKPIPAENTNKNYNLDILDISECLMDLSKYSILCEPYYYREGKDGAIDKCYVREAVASRLIMAENSLPRGYKFKVYDAFRPEQLQKSLWFEFREVVKASSRGFSDSYIDNKTSLIVDNPNISSRCAPSNTGGVICLTIIDENGHCLSMGNNFGEISDMNETGYFENKKSSDIQSNRRLLYNVMTSAGFVNTSYRWWEYSYGDVVWAAKNGMSQLYGSAEKLIKGDMIRECKIINKGEQESLR